MLGYKSLEKRRRRHLVWAVAGVSILTVMFAASLLARTPPRRIVLATGQRGGAFDTLGAEYKKRLEHLGLHVDIVSTSGSVDNLKRLLSHEADVAFVQAGTYPLVEDPDDHVRGLAAIYFEPLWIFHREETAPAQLTQFRGKRIALGLHGSGSETLAKEILGVHGVDAGNSKFLNLPLGRGREQLLKGKVDMLIAVSAYQDSDIADLLRRPDVRLWNIRREAAYCRRFPFLTPVKLSEGILDLEANVPAEDRTLLAPAAQLVGRDDLDPRVVEQILKIAQAIHAPGSLLDAPQRFPSLEGMDVRAHEAAETYLKSGESLLSRLLPYWGVRVLYQARVLLLPVLFLWLPFLRMLPMIYNYRVSNLLKKHYVALREIEDSLASAADPQQLHLGLGSLETLVNDMESLSRKVPGHLQRDVYHWRLHVSMVKAEALDRLKRLQASGANEGEKPKCEE